MPHGTTQTRKIVGDVSCMIWELRKQTVFERLLAQVVLIGQWATPSMDLSRKQNSTNCVMCVVSLRRKAGTEPLAGSVFLSGYASEILGDRVMLGTNATHFGQKS
eukprot:5570387-Amphidinium_carterae.2